LSRGLDAREVQPHRAAKSISQEVTFDRDCSNHDECRRVLQRLSEGVGRRLRSLGLAGGVVRIKVRLPPFETHTRQSKLAAPVQDDLAIYDRAAQLFDSFVSDGQAVRLLGVGVEGLGSERGPVQRGLFETSTKVERATRAMDAIRARHGDDAIRRGR